MSNLYSGPMGVLYEYFRAADAGAAAEPVRPDWAGPFRPPAGRTAFDGLPTKGIDPAVMVAKLVGLVRGLGWSMDLVSLNLVTSTDGHEQLVLALDDAARDTLADIPPDAASDLGARWAEIEEFSGEVDPEALAGFIVDLAALAGRARAAGEHLYCWACL
jgi:hypothetical protein